MEWQIEFDEAFAEEFSQLPSSVMVELRAQAN